MRTVKRAAFGAGICSIYAGLMGLCVIALNLYEWLVNGRVHADHLLWGLPAAALGLTATAALLWYREDPQEPRP